MRRPVAIALAFVALAAGASPLVAGRPVRYPSAVSYQRALRTERLRVIAPALRGARVARGADGKAIAPSGGFGTVLRLERAGAPPAALRLFHPPAAAEDRFDLTAFGARYRALGSYLDRLRAAGRLPRALAGFEFVDDAVALGGTRLPGLVMPWIEGRSLETFVTARVQRRDAAGLVAMAEAFRAMVADLGRAGLAHGDLHPGNILVTPADDLVLVDYDAMYAPSLEGLASAEIGKPAFQHPAYFFLAAAPLRRPFDARMDHFSATVIYLSLRALAADPSLFRFHTPGANLILRAQEDLLDPDASPVFARLARSPDRQVRRLASHLARLADGAATEVPPLEETLAAIEAEMAASPKGG